MLWTLQQIGEPEGLPEAIVWLLATRQAWSTGQVLGSDGELATVQVQERSA